ncbi:ead/Ea22-like family protein [Enterobacter kobei]
MSNIDKRALREAAERAGQNAWEYVYTSDLSAPGRGYITVGGAEAIYCLNKAAGGVKQSENVLRYIAAASPETMLALLNEIAELEQRHCGTALLEREEMHTKTLGRMLDELEAAENRIAELEAREVVVNLPAYVDGRTLGYGEVNHMIDLCADAIEKAGHAAGIITKVGGGRDMKIGDHMQEVVGLVNDLTGYETESALKLLALVVGEYMINADATEVNINAGVMSIKVEITVPGEE